MSCFGFQQGELIDWMRYMVLKLVRPCLAARQIVMDDLHKMEEEIVMPFAIAHSGPGYIDSPIFTVSRLEPFLLLWIVLDLQRGCFKNPESRELGSQKLSMDTRRLAAKYERVCPWLFGLEGDQGIIGHK